MKSYSLVISDAALLDIEEAIGWYESQKAGLGTRMTLSLNEGISVIENNPLLVAKKYKEVRVQYIKRFPYGIHFKIEQNVVKIFGFFHVKRNPIKWNTRLKK